MVELDMPDSLSSLPMLQSYAAFALTLAAGFYAAMRFFGGHLSRTAKDNLALWLLGAYDSTWPSHFCKLFDVIFGDRHLSWRCFLCSAVASLLGVVILWTLIDPILGLVDRRTTGALNIWQTMVLGAAINVFPDYLSLLETRWLLQRFQTVRSIGGQLLVLAADALFTGAIIWLAISGFILVRSGSPLSIVEILALFSIYSIFFYSTFLTSVWAWLYCLSTWFMRLFSQTSLSHILAIEEKPGDQVALVGATLLAAATIALAPLLHGGVGQANRIDRQLCNWFPDEACGHVARITVLSVKTSIVSVVLGWTAFQAAINARHS